MQNIKEKISNPKLKIILVAVIAVNILAITLQIISYKSNIEVYKKSLIDRGNSILHSFESGNRAFLFSGRFSKAILLKFMREISKEKIIKNFVIYDQQKNILLSLVKIEKDLLTTSITSKSIVEEKNALVIFKPYDTFVQSSMKLNFFGAKVQFRKKQLYLALYLNNMDLIKLKGKLFFNVLLICALQLLVLTLYYYTVKVTNLYIAARSRMRKAEKAAELGKFSTILAHEIKNPLSSMSGLIKYAIGKNQNTDESTNINVCLTKSVEEIERLNSIVNDFLTFGKPIVLETKELHLKTIVEKTLDLVKHDYSSKDVNINLWGDDFIVNVDENKILQVFVNLILNSIDASPKNESVDITIESQTHTLCIKNKVSSDQKPDTEQLFDPFYSTKVKGSGLGLAISKKILEQHAASISIENINPFMVKISFKGLVK